MCTNYTSQSFRLNSVVLSDISKFSTVIEQLSVSSRRPQPLGALRRLPHLASRSYATGQREVGADFFDLHSAAMALSCDNKHCAVCTAIVGVSLNHVINKREYRPHRVCRDNKDVCNVSNGVQDQYVQCLTSIRYELMCTCLVLRLIR